MFPSAKAVLRASALAVTASLCLSVAEAQTIRTQSTKRKTRVAVEDTSVSPLVTEAEAAIEKQDLKKAEELLLRATTANVKDHRAWFDLGYVYAATERRDLAIDAYAKSVQAKPDVFESNLGLGKLLGSVGRSEESAKYLRAATQLKPERDRNANLATAWTLLGAVLRTTDPKGSAQAFEQALQLDPKNLGAMFNVAHAHESAKDLASAQATYQKILTAYPDNADALSGLADVLLAQDKTVEAETIVRRVLQADATNATARYMLGRILLKNGKSEEALPHLEAALQAKPEPALLQQVVQLYIDAKKFDQASALLKKGIASSPKDAKLRHQLGVLLMRARNFKESETELINAINLDPNAVEAYGDLAIVASENKNYPLALKALDYRAKLAPETAGTVWLRATAHDHMRVPQEASKYYREFLAMANGQFPDKEWQARHRLIAIDPKYSEKKK